MKIITCYECKKQKQEIEFEYLFFKKKYNNICKKCQEKKNLNQKVQVFNIVKF